MDEKAANQVILAGKEQALAELQVSLLLPSPSPHTSFRPPPDINLDSYETASKFDEFSDWHSEERYLEPIAFHLYSIPCSFRINYLPASTSSGIITREFIEYHALERKVNNLKKIVRRIIT
jgi:hypothetical protein